MKIRYGVYIKAPSLYVEKLLSNKPASDALSCQMLKEQPQVWISGGAQGTRPHFYLEHVHLSPLIKHESSGGLLL